MTIAGMHGKKCDICGKPTGRDIRAKYCTDCLRVVTEKQLAIHAATAARKKAELKAAGIMPKKKPHSTGMDILVYAE